MYPIIVCDPDNVSQKIIQEKFELFVDTGKYVGTMREYIGDGENAKDVKSGKTRREITSKEYSREEFKNLLNEIAKRNTTIPIKPDLEKIKQQNIRLQELKREAENGLNNEIVKFVTNMMSILNLKTDTEKNNKMIRLINNMGVFNNTVPPLSKNDESSRNKIKMQNFNNSIRLKYVKKVFNQYFRYHLSMIQNGYKLDKYVEELTYTTESVSKELQQEMFKEYDMFNKFMLEDQRNYFNDVQFEMTANEVDSIYGKDPIYNSTFTDIIENSDLDNNQASMILILILIKELNSFIYCVRDDTMMKSSEDMGGVEKSKIIEQNARKCFALCEFFMTVFQLVERDHIFIDECSDKVSNIKNRMIKEIIDSKLKNIQDEELGNDNYFLKIYNLNQMKTKTATKISDIDETISGEQEEIDNEMMNSNRKDVLREQIMETYKKSGMEFTQSQLDEAVEQAENSLLEDEMIEKEENQLGELIDEDAIDAGDEILGDGNYGDYIENDSD